MSLRNLPAISIKAASPEGHRGMLAIGNAGHCEAVRALTMGATGGLVGSIQANAGGDRRGVANVLAELNEDVSTFKKTYHGREAQLGTIGQEIDNLNVRFAGVQLNGGRAPVAADPA